MGVLAKPVDGDVLQPVRQVSGQAALRRGHGQAKVAGGDLLSQRGQRLLASGGVDGDALARIAGSEDVSGGLSTADTTSPRAFATGAGAERVRAGVPKGWTVADKTGTGSYGTLNDIAVVWPPRSAPIVISIMSSKATEDAAYDQALIAEAAAYAVATLAPKGESPRGDLRVGVRRRRSDRADGGPPHSCVRTGP
ncbi:hypothetical protein RKD30_002173 [Streptomyces pristinaespiralis]